MTENTESTTLEVLKARMNRQPTQVEAAQIKKNIKVIESEWSKISIKDGLQFILDLRKEANRQKAMKACKNFELQTRDIKYVPAVPHEAMERRLAEDFEITEEFEDDE